MLIEDSIELNTVEVEELPELETSEEEFTIAPVTLESLPLVVEQDEYYEDSAEIVMTKSQEAKFNQETLDGMIAADYEQIAKVSCIFQNITIFQTIENATEPTLFEETFPSPGDEVPPTSSSSTDEQVLPIMCNLTSMVDTTVCNCDAMIDRLIVEKERRKAVDEVSDELELVGVGPAAVSPFSSFSK